MKKIIVAIFLMLLASSAPTGLAGADTAIPEGTVTSGTPQGYLATLNRTQGIMVRDIVQVLRGGKTVATAIVSRVTDYDCTLLVTDPIGATLRKDDAGGMERSTDSLI